MPGLKYEAAAEFTGSAAAAFPVQLPALPVAGALRRFSAKATGVPVGATVATWKDSAGSGTTLAPVSSTAPTLATVAGVRSVLFNGTNQGLQQSVSMTNPHSIVLVSNVVTPNTTATTTQSGSFVTSGVDAGRVQTSLTGLYVNAGTGAQVGTGLNVTGWRVIVVSFNGASTVVNINGAEYTVSAGILPRAVFTLGFERGASWSNVAIAEAALYNGALDSTQRAALVTGLRAEYGI